MREPHMSDRLRRPGVITHGKSRRVHSSGSVEGVVSDHDSYSFLVPQRGHHRRLRLKLSESQHRRNGTRGFPWTVFLNPPARVRATTPRRTTSWTWRM